MRAIVPLAICLIVASGAAAQQSERLAPSGVTALRDVDRDLSALCRRCAQRCLETDAARLAGYWRARVVIIEKLPASSRAAVAKNPAVPNECLAIARLAAERVNSTPAPHRDRYGGPPNPVPPPVTAEMRRIARGTPSSKPSVPPSSSPPATIEMELARGTPSSKPSVPPSSSPPAVASRPPAAAKNGSPPTVAPTVANEIQNFFPWPPPTPSTRRSLTLSRLSPGAPLQTWGDAADQIERILRQAQFEFLGLLPRRGRLCRRDPC